MDLLVAITTKMAHEHLEEIKNFLDKQKHKYFNEEFDFVSLRYSDEIDKELTENQESFLVKYYTDRYDPRCLDGYAHYVFEQICKICNIAE